MEKAILKRNNEKLEKRFSHMKKELHTIKKKGEKSTIETKFNNMVIQFQCLKLQIKLMRRK